MAISGKNLPTGISAPLTEEEKELARLKKLKETSPDIFPTVDVVDQYVRKRWVSVVKYLVDQGMPPNHDKALIYASQSGQPEMVALLLSSSTPATPKDLKEGLEEASGKGHLAVVKLLFEAIEKRDQFPLQESLIYAIGAQRWQIADVPRDTLSTDLRIQLARKDLYPKWSEFDGITLSSPEHRSNSEISKQISPHRDFLTELLKQNFPVATGRSRSFEKNHAIDLKKMTWSLVRTGKTFPISPLEITNETFRPGDILEITARAFLTSTSSRETLASILFRFKTATKWK